MCETSPWDVRRCATARIMNASFFFGLLCKDRLAENNHPALEDAHFYLPYWSAVCLQGPRQLEGITESGAEPSWKVFTLHHFETWLSTFPTVVCIQVETQERFINRMPWLRYEQSGKFWYEWSFFTAYGDTQKHTNEEAFCTCIADITMFIRSALIAQ